jgi:hypothetical protein
MPAHRKCIKWISRTRRHLAGYVRTETLPTGSVQYEITETGRAAVADG